MKQPLKGILITLVIIVAVVAAAYWFVSHHQSGEPGILTFEQCMKAGYPIEETYPRRCSARNKVFTEDVTSTPATATTTATATQPAVATSSKNIRVTAPTPHQKIGAVLTIVGEAREFENTFAWRLRDADGSALIEGHAMANAPDVGQFGPFTVTSTYPAPKGTHGTVEVFARSAKDGSEIDRVSIPVNF
jgi:hypothetical protein